MAIEANTTPHAVSSGALAKAATPTAAKSPNQMWKAIAPVAAAVVLAQHRDAIMPALGRVVPQRILA